MKGASQIAPLGVRIPDELKEKIQAQAKDNGRSTNAEIVQILESSFSQNSPNIMSRINELVSHYESLIALKDEIIETQKSTISHMQGTISSLEQSVDIQSAHINTLEKHIKILEDDAHKK